MTVRMHWCPAVRCAVDERGHAGRNREGDATDSRCPHRVSDELHLPGDPAVYLETGPDLDRMGNRRPGRYLGVQPQRLLPRSFRLPQGLVQAARHQRGARGHHPPPDRAADRRQDHDGNAVHAAQFPGGRGMATPRSGRGGRGPRRPRWQPELPDLGPVDASGSAGTGS